MSMLFKGAMQGFGVLPETCMALAIATDHLSESKANVLMLALQSFVDPDRDINVFVSGGDVMATQRYTGIPKQVYEELAVAPDIAAEMIAAKLEEYGVSNLVCHSALRFVKPIVRKHKLVSNAISFVDIGLMHKALGFWTENLRQASNLIDLQEKVARMRGANIVKLGVLAEAYDVKPEDTEESPYIPERKARVVRDIFEAQLDMELPF